MNYTAQDMPSKLPEITLTFWIIKIAATTLGETGGDTVSMSWATWSALRFSCVCLFWR
jgi:uncharacterized membrane-anchored protein